MLDRAAQPTPARARRPRPGDLALAAAALVYVLWVAGEALAPVAVAAAPARLEVLATIFLGIFIEALPFLLLGVLASATIQLFLPAERVRRFSPRHPALAALAGATLGLTVLPVCECGTVPATRRLLAKGAPLPLGLAFLLAAPAVNPVVIASTWIAFGGQPLIVFGRLGLTVAIATTVGIVLGRHPAPGTVLPPPAGEGEGEREHEHGHASAGQGRLAALLRGAGGEFFEMTRYLVVGAAIAATFQTVVPQEALLALGQGPVLSVLALMALALVLSICSTVDAFVALAFAGDFLPGAILAFLVFGPMVDIKSVLLFDTTFRRRTVVALVGLTATLVLLAAVAINLIVA